jgi:pilus assembly protein TadC
MMAVDERLDRLSRQLSMQSLGPVDTVFTEAMSRVGSASSSLAAWLRQAAYDQPLITLLLSCQVGYLVARFGRRHARR